MGKWACEHQDSFLHKLTESKSHIKELIRTRITSPILYPGYCDITKIWKSISVYFVI